MKELAFITGNRHRHVSYGVSQETKTEGEPVSSLFELDCPSAHGSWDGFCFLDIQS